MDKYRGTTLDGWLAAETGSDPEFFLRCQKDPAVFQAHLDSFIRQEDFLFISSLGLNAVLIPLPLHVFEISLPGGNTMAGYVDRAIDWAAISGLKILLCPVLPEGWYRHSEERKDALKALQKLARRYGSHPALLGIEAGCPETGFDVPPRRDIGSIKAFYREAYEMIRAILPQDRIIVFHDAFTLTVWRSFFRKSCMKNIALDTGISLSLPEKYFPTARSWGFILCLKLLKRNLRQAARDIPLLICRWNLSSSYADRMGRSVMELREYEDLQRTRYRQLARLAFPVLDETGGWFYQSYKTSDVSEKKPDLHSCVEKGWLTKGFLAGKGR